MSFVIPVTSRAIEVPGFDAYRWKLLTRQEERRHKHGAPAFSCACEASQLATEE